MTKSIIFWLVTYPRSIAGTIKYLSDHYNVTCFCLDAKIDPMRIKMGWGYDSIGNAQLIDLSTIDNKEQYIQEKLSNLDNDSLHFMLGYRNAGINKYVYKYVLPNNKNVAVIAERRTEYGLPIYKRILSSIFYYTQTLRIRSKVKFLLAMGTLGVKSYNLLGWDKDKVMPFIYHKVTKLDDSVTLESNTSIQHQDRPIRFLYVGRYDKRKGSDILKGAFSKLKGKSGWTLDLVGANGELMDTMVEWANSVDAVNYLGVWDSIEVSQNTSLYDVCLVPSRDDGWGMFVTESIESGVGCITTETTGAKDLVSSSHAGIVVNPGDVDELYDAIKKCIDSPNLVKEWKNMALKYRDRISDEAIGEYVISCIKFFVDKSGSRPQCPWI